MVKQLIIVSFAGIVTLSIWTFTLFTIFSEPETYSASSAPQEDPASEIAEEEADNSTNIEPSIENSAAAIEENEKETAAALETEENEPVTESEQIEIHVREPVQEGDTLQYGEGISIDTLLSTN